MERTFFKHNPLSMCLIIIQICINISHCEYNVTNNVETSQSFENETISINLSFSHAIIIGSSVLFFSVLFSLSCLYLCYQRSKAAKLKNYVANKQKSKKTDKVNSKNAYSADPNEAPILSSTFNLKINPLSPPKVDVHDLEGYIKNSNQIRPKTDQKRFDNDNDNDNMVPKQYSIKKNPTLYNKIKKNDSNFENEIHNIDTIENIVITDVIDEMDTDQYHGSGEATPRKYLHKINKSVSKLPNVKLFDVKLPKPPPKRISQTSIDCSNNSINNNDGVWECDTSDEDSNISDTKNEYYIKRHNKILTLLTIDSNNVENPFTNSMKINHLLLNNTESLVLKSKSSSNNNSI